MELWDGYVVSGGGGAVEALCTGNGEIGVRGKEDRGRRREGRSCMLDTYRICGDEYALCICYL